MEIGRTLKITLFKCWNRIQFNIWISHSRSLGLGNDKSPALNLQRARIASTYFLSLFSSGFLFAASVRGEKAAHVVRIRPTRAETPCSINYTAYYKFSHAFSISTCCICVCNQNFSRLVVVRRVPLFFLLLSICAHLSPGPCACACISTWCSVFIKN